MDSVTPRRLDFTQEAKLPESARNGLRITSVAGNGPSYRQLQQNQIILGVLFPKGQTVKSVDDLNAATASLKNGDVIELKTCFPDPSTGTCPTAVASVQVQR